MAKIIVLGVGLVGRAIAIDLAKSHDTTAADIDATALKSFQTETNIATVLADLSDSNALTKLVADYDLVVGAVPGFMGFSTVQTVIEAGKNIVDISFFPEDAFELDALAKEKGVIAAVDCGVAPGVSNLTLGFHNKRMKIDRFMCYVGGLPETRTQPYEYKAPFSPIDVIEEYTRPARLVEKGAVVIKQALSEPEFLEFDGIGTLEAFNTDGLRSLIQTMDIPNMSEKTMRYPGHREIMATLRDSGFFSEKPINIGGASVRPIDLTSTLLFNEWKLNPGEKELTVMKIIIEGLEDGQPKSYTYDLLDRYDSATKTSSMARTTGYTCTAIANLVVNGDVQRVGINPPEFIGSDESCYNKIFKYLKDRGVIYIKNEKKINL
jgi:lysine 6-dehydrogenase